MTFRRTTQYTLMTLWWLMKGCMGPRFCNAVFLSLEFCISMFINLYIARPRYRFILIYTCGLTAVIKRIRYVMLCYVVWIAELVRVKKS